ncbi:MAG: rRNA maturation RNase YbeY [bacterium]|nr:rRNA maturation RNase YbeY [bacterium]
MRAGPRILTDRRGRLGLYAPTMEREALAALRHAARAAGLNAGHELSLLLCDNVIIRRINRRWRDIDRPTDVLSFPLHELRPGQAPPPGAVGDIVIALPTVRQAARSEGIDPAAHLRRLIIHGLLHLLGHDHATDRQARRMTCEEARLLAATEVA